MNFLLSLLGGGLFEKLGGFIKIFTGDREKREDAQATLQGKVMDEFASENLEQRENRTGWDSFIDGVNRIPRPFGFFVTVWVFVWPVVNMESFTSAMVSYEAIPQWLTVLIISVWGLYFGGRLLTQDVGFKAVGNAQINQILESQKKIHETFASQKALEAQGEGAVSSATQVAKDPYAAVPGRLSGAAFEKAMKDPAPLSLPAVVEWNRLHKEGKI